MFIGLLVLCVVLVGGGIFYYSSQIKQEAIPKQEELKIVQSEDAKEEVSQKEKKVEIEKRSVQAPINSGKTTNEQKNTEQLEAFTKKVISQDYYVEKVDSTGKLTYVKATEKVIQELEGKTKANKLSTYQVNYKGQMISVLTTS